MKKAGKICVFFLLIVTAFAGVYQTRAARAADMKNVEEQDGVLVNVSQIFHHERYVNGYYFYNIIMYMEGDRTYFTMTVKNMTSVARGRVEFDCPVYDEDYWRMGNIGSHIAELEPGASTQTMVVMTGSYSLVDAYDFAIVFAEEDIIDAAKDVTVNKDVLCDKNEALQGEEVTIQSEEKGEYATYQWFYAEGLADVGVPVEGADKREYKIQDIPLAYSGRYYYCKIWKEDRVTDSKRVKLIVYNERNIQVAMVGEEAVAGKPFTLKAKFEFNAQGYQFEWYSSDTENLSEAGKLEGEETSILITEYTEGGKYYWCAARKEDEYILSDAFYLEVHEISDVSGSAANDTSTWQVKNLTVKQMDKPIVKLTWKKCNTESIVILRSEKRKSDYQAVKKLKGGRVSYADKTVKRGRTYYYKVVSFNGAVTEDVFLCEAKVKKIEIDYLMRPVIVVTKGVAGGQKYVQITLKEFEGEYVEIYMKEKSGYQKLAMEKGKNRTGRKKYRFRYAKGNAKILFRARTYRTIGGKKYYSRFSREAQIKI